MIKNKIKMLFNYKNVKQSDFIELLDMSSRQALNNKFAKDRFTVQDVIKICNELDCTLQIVDNTSKNTIVSFGIEDTKKDDH